MGTSRLKIRRRQNNGLKWTRVAIAILSTTGLFYTGKITLHRWGFLGTLSCPGGNNGCAQVLNSPWGTISQIGGYEIPLSLMGFFCYLSLLILSLSIFFPGISESKNNFIRKSWWGLFILSCSMSVFSLILISIMFFKINAFCLFCIISAFISLFTFILVLIGGGWEDTGKLFFRGILLSLVVLLGGLFWNASVDPNRIEVATFEKGVPPLIRTQSTNSAIALAKHLTNNGVSMYNAYWCPHCHEQKELFGKEASSNLLLIECAQDGKNNQHTLCIEKGITSYPSWEINGIIESGVKSLNELAEITGYKGPKDF